MAETAGTDDYLARAREALARSSPYLDGFGAEIVSAREGEVRARMPFSADLCRFNGTLHGGAIASFADAVGVVCAALHAQGELAGTLEFKVNFFRPVSQGAIEAIARPLHSGRTSFVMQTEVVDEAGRAVAFATQTQAVRPEK